MNTNDKTMAAALGMRREIKEADGLLLLDEIERTFEACIVTAHAPAGTYPRSNPFKTVYSSVTPSDLRKLGDAAYRLATAIEEASND